MNIPARPAALILVAIAAISPLATSQPSAEGAFEQQPALPATEQGDSQTSNFDPKFTSLYTGKQQIFAWTFGDWEPNSLHWNAPSSLTIYNDGSYYLYAKRTANFRRTGGSIDSGGTRVPGVSVTYYSGPLAGGQCTGVVVHTAVYNMMSVDYKTEKFDNSTGGTDMQLAAKLPNIRCPMASRHWQ